MKEIIVCVVNRKHITHKYCKIELKSFNKNAAGIPSSFNCRKLKRNGETEKHYTINEIVYFVSNNKL